MQLSWTCLVKFLMQQCLPFNNTYSLWEGSSSQWLVRKKELKDGIQQEMCIKRNKSEIQAYNYMQHICLPHLSLSIKALHKGLAGISTGKQVDKQLSPIQARKKLTYA